MSDLVALAPGRPPLALASAAAPSAATVLRRLGAGDLTALGRGGARSLAPWLVGAALSVTAVAGLLSLREPTRATLFPGLGDADKALVMETLKTGGFDVVVNTDTGQVEVPDRDLYRARMALAAAGLPKAVPGGYDLLATMPLGASRGLERARLKQAQEEELARAIGSVAGVATARVLLGIPDPSPFVRETVQPTASVFVGLAPGRALSDAQVRAVQNLVGSSVPGLPADRVSVVDGAGQLLSPEADDENGPNNKNIAYKSRLERQYRERVQGLLGPVLGPGNFSVEVNADLDFSENQSTTESFQPGNTAVRSEQTTQRNDAQPPARGVPGALTNVAPPAPTVGAAPPAPIPGSPTGNATSSETSTTRNFEVGKAVAVQKKPIGALRRLGVAIVVREPPAGTPGARPDPAVLQRLVAAAVGLDPARGDVVNIVRQPFVSPPIPDAPPLWRQLLDRHAGHLVALVGLVVAGLLAMRLLRRPKPPVPAAAPEPLPEPAVLIAAEAEAEPEPGPDDAPATTPPADTAGDILSCANTYDAKVAAIRQFVTADPARATAVFQAMLAKPTEIA